MTNCKGPCDCGTTTAAHRIGCMAVGAAMPNLMVTPSGDAFYADGPEDALAFYTEHGALPANPAAEPALWDLLPPAARAVMDLVAEAAAFANASVQPTTGGPVDMQLPEGCTGHYREDIDRGDVLVHTTRCPVHTHTPLPLGAPLSSAATFGNTAASATYPADGGWTGEALALPAEGPPPGCICDVVPGPIMGERLIRVKGDCPAHARTQTYTFNAYAAGLRMMPAIDFDAVAADGSREALAAAVAHRHQSVRDLVAYFAWAHLVPRLQAVSAPFGELALHVVSTTPDSAELAAGLRKLLEAKDCCVRAAL